MLCINFYKIVFDSVFYVLYVSIYMWIYVYEYWKEKLKKYLLFIEDYSIFIKGWIFVLLKYR